MPGRASSPRPGSPGQRWSLRTPRDRKERISCEYRPCHAGGRWTIALAAVAVIAWIAFIELLALFVTTSTA